MCRTQFFWNSKLFRMLSYKKRRIIFCAFLRLGQFRALSVWNASHFKPYGLSFYGKIRFSIHVGPGVRCIAASCFAFFWGQTFLGPVNIIYYFPVIGQTYPHNQRILSTHWPIVFHVNAETSLWITSCTSAMLHIAENGCNRLRLPKEFGSLHSIYSQMNRWVKMTVLPEFLSGCNTNGLFPLIRQQS